MRRWLVLTGVLVVGLAITAAWASVGWWAVFRWVPEDEPPGRVVTGPFRTEQECRDWGLGFQARMVGMQFIRCIQIQPRLIP